MNYSNSLLALLTLPLMILKTSIKQQKKQHRFFSLVEVWVMGSGSSVLMEIR